MIVTINFVVLYFNDIPKRLTTNPTNNTKGACVLNIRSIRLLRCEKNNYGQGWF